MVTQRGSATRSIRAASAIVVIFSLRNAPASSSSSAADQRSSIRYQAAQRVHLDSEH